MKTSSKNSILYQHKSFPNLEVFLTRVKYKPSSLHLNLSVNVSRQNLGWGFWTNGTKFCYAVWWRHITWAYRAQREGKKLNIRNGNLKMRLLLNKTTLLFRFTLKSLTFRLRLKCKFLRREFGFLWHSFEACLCIIFPIYWQRIENITGTK